MVPQPSPHNAANGLSSDALTYTDRPAHDGTGGKSVQRNQECRQDGSLIQAAAAVGLRRRTPTVHSAARVIAMSAPWSKAPATFTSAANALSCASRSSTRSAGAAAPQDAVHRHPHSPRDQRTARPYVIGQEHAKKVLSVAVHNHYKRLVHGEEPDPMSSSTSPTSCSSAPPAAARRCWRRTLAQSERPLRHRRRHHADRGRLRR